MGAETLPLVSASELDTIDNDPAAYIVFLTDRYYQIISSDPSGQIQEQFTIEQNILLAFNILDTQVTSGGFIQLIENLYGAYIFDTQLSEYINKWGAKTIAAIIDEARPIYHQKKEILEREKTLEEFAKLYQEHKDFEILEKLFDQSILSERIIIKEYIECNIHKFANIKS